MWNAHGSDELARREAEGKGLCCPENAVLVAYSKITLSELIEDSTLPDEPWFQRVLAGYFPRAIAERAARALRDEFAPIDDMRASAGYRRTVLANLMRRFCIEMAGDSRTVTRVEALTTQ